MPRAVERTQPNQPVLRPSNRMKSTAVWCFTTLKTHLLGSKQPERSRFLTSHRLLSNTTVVQSARTANTFGLPLRQHGVPIDSSDGDDDFLDRWADPDTEQSLGDPERSIRIPKAPSVTNYESVVVDTERLEADLSAVDGDLLNTFAVCVLLTKAGVLLVSIGLLLAVFRGQLAVGGVLVLAGSFSLVRAIQHYRAYELNRSDEADSAEQNH